MNTSKTCLSNKVELMVAEGLDEMNNIPWLREHLSGEYIQRCIDYAKTLRGSILVSNSNPKTTASCILYIASTMTASAITQVDCARALGNTEVTIRNNWKRVAKELKIRG